MLKTNRKSKKAGANSHMANSGNNCAANDSFTAVAKPARKQSGVTPHFTAQHSEVLAVHVYSCINGLNNSLKLPYYDVDSFALWDNTDGKICTSFVNNAYFLMILIFCNLTRWLAFLLAHVSLNRLSYLSLFIAYL